MMTDERKKDVHAIRAANLAKGRMHRFRGGNPKQRKFVEKYVKSGNKMSAYREVYGDKGEHTRRYAYVVLHNPTVQKLIAGVEENLAKAAQGSVDKMVELRDSAESEKIQLGAAAGLLGAYADMMRRQQKEMEPTATSNNILITGMTDDELIQRISQYGASGTLSGAHEAEVQEGPVPADGGSAGLQEPGAHAPGDSAEPAEGGEEGKGTVPPPPRSSEEYGDYR